MKRIILIAALFASLASNSQTVRATIKAGTQANSVIIAIRPSADISAARLSSVSIALAVPASATPKPTASVRNSINPNITWDYQESPAPENVAGKGSYHIYNFLGDGAQTVAAERTYTAAADNDLVEIQFNGGPLSTAEVLLVNIPDGGATGQSNWYISNRGTDITDVTNMFYGSAATNGPGGLSGTSFAALGNVALPVKFLSFFAIKNGDDAKLNWTVESDENNNFFEVERSTDGRVYRPLNKVAAKANGRSVNTYESADFALSKLGTNQVFYRIKQVDRDGQITFSNIRNLNAVRRGTPVQLFPNPVKSITKLVIDADAPGKASITIRDMGGKLVQQINTLLVRGVNQQDLNVAALASGEYTVLVVGEGFNHTLKLNKIN
ncbi:MAG: T9SS type A sorting domain-containing protein [Chitinophagaceae bacterium]|nr:T9SS type A sorting domain-containing protein [Chitinophagaceae bacterium]